MTEFKKKPSFSKYTLKRVSARQGPFNLREKNLAAFALAQMERAESAEAKNAKLNALYNELIFEVGHKYPDETRHETARRYIMEAEKLDPTPYADPAARAEVDP